MLSLGCTGFYFSSMATTKPHRTPSWWKFRDAFGPTWFLALGAAHELATHQKIPRGSVMVEPKDIRFHSGEVTAGRHDEVGPFPSFAFQDYISVRVDSDEVRLKVESQKQQGVDCGNMYIPVCLVKYEALPLQSGNNLMSWEVLGEANGHIPRVQELRRSKVWHAVVLPYLFDVTKRLELVFTRDKSRLGADHIRMGPLVLLPAWYTLHWSEETHRLHYPHPLCTNKKFPGCQTRSHWNGSKCKRLTINAGSILVNSALPPPRWSPPPTRKPTAALGGVRWRVWWPSFPTRGTSL
eukprot:TRINITY_DN157_c0_g2_i4.p2 TRINITY_DN157_c0_g2~~TRINITY_DN157_c0_g2_i4.p2  ORF type:complete len:295 (+),score=19.83 TRINITY_DN157_c0_g2_i4:591-1475(+)